MESISKTHVIVKILTVIIVALVFGFTSTPVPTAPVESQIIERRSILWVIDHPDKADPRRGDSEARILEVSYA